MNRTAAVDVGARENILNSGVQAIRLVVADDSGIYRDGLSNLLSMQRDFVVAGSADTPAAAVEQIREHRPDIVLLGWAASSAGSQRVFAAIQEGRLSTRVIMLSDANATWTDAEHAATLNSFMLFFGDVMSVDDAIGRFDTAEGRKTA